MKLKVFLFAATFILVSFIAKATDINGPEPTGMKEDIQGSVVNAESKKPLRDVTITVFNSSKKEKTAVSDCDGEYSFNDLKPGVYKFVFEKTGYRKVVKEKVIVKVDEAFQMNIEMIEEQITDVMPSPSNFLYN